MEETVSIEKTYLRASMLPKHYCDNARGLLRQYVDARFDLDNAGLDTAGFNEAANVPNRFRLNFG
jgi:hypothetical protein